MKSKLKILLYGNVEEYKIAENYIRNLPLLSNVQCEFFYMKTLNEMESILVNQTIDLIVVFADGAEGMESVYLCRRMLHDIPVCWFSDDNDFGMQSHRLECIYFATKPMTEEKLNRALTRYLQMC